jgi:hypothetical protein
MDLVTLAQEIEERLNQDAKVSERLTDIGPDGAVFGFEMDEEISGFISCESNQDGVGIPTVSISLTLGSVQELSQRDFLDLLLINGDLVDATITVTPEFEDSGDQFLLLQRKLRAEGYDTGSFTQHVESLLELANLFFAEE